MKTDEYIKECRKNLKKKMFSRDSFNELLVIYLNDSEFKSHIMEKNGDSVKKVSTYPVKKFRKILYNILVDFGVDPKDAETVKNDYKFTTKTVDGLYEFITDFLYQYLQTGRKLKLLNKENVEASIYLQDKEAEEHQERKFQKEILGYYDAAKHSILKSESKCPEWKKTIYDLNNNLIKKMKIEIPEE